MTKATKAPNKQLQAVSDRLGELQEDLAIVDTYINAKKHNKLSKYALVKLRGIVSDSITHLEDNIVEEVSWAK